MKIVNRRASYEYLILERVEAGIVLTGAEVKSLRMGHGSLEEAFARVKEDGAWLYNFFIPAYPFADAREYEPSRPRKLLLHRRELMRLAQRLVRERLTIVPLACYTTGRFMKVELGVGRGRKKYEKRELLKKRDIEREVAAEFKQKLR